MMASAAGRTPGHSNASSTHRHAPTTGAVYGEPKNITRVCGLAFFIAAQTGRVSTTSPMASVRETMTRAGWRLDMETQFAKKGSVQDVMMRVYPVNERLKFPMKSVKEPTRAAENWVKEKERRTRRESLARRVPLNRSSGLVSALFSCGEWTFSGTTQLYDSYKSV